MADDIGFDPVAWSIDGGRHPGDLLRLMAYAATSGSEGIVSLGDCKVHELGTPGGQVAIDAGALLIRNRSETVANQTYVANGRRQTKKDVTATGASARSDLLVIRIEDPQYDPWPQPLEADAPTYQYVRPFIIENVPPTTKSAVELDLGYSAVALARIDIPANTATILDDYIVDLRQVANPRSKRVVKGLNNQDQHTFFYEDLDWHPWPLYADFMIDVPEWATHVVYSLAFGQIIPVYQDASATAGYLRLNVGNGTLLGDLVQWEVDAGNATNPQSILNGDEHLIPAALRGTRARFQVEARRVTGTSDIRWHPVSSLVLDITFEERAA